ncbi:gliding motility lipoprotein GldB [Adhaeribacter aerolatus]|uniref:Gliding motility lipoprotein GldB n=1 Tax=Adhaeribacter aerolatus TaxID=670289 RepID=A0A512ATD0_9BACT|nr:gliding motility lipoprotein GldB [Adhaeribacter aerolatus]GEO02964.1 gliding motility lipoprotein GldB [Adhaeribacter aerolatus]
MRKQIVLLFTLLFILSCGKQNCEINPEVAKIDVNVQIERLEQPFYGLKNEKEVAAFLEKHPVFADKYLQRGEYPGEEQLVGSLLQLIREPNLQKFAKETEQHFGDMADVQQDLTNAFKHLKYYYPQFAVPQVKTFVSGLLGPDIFLSDSLVIIGLDYFAGRKASYRPQQPDYILQRYEKENIVPALVTLISSKYNKTDQKNTMLAEMVNYGKSYYFTKQMMPCTPDSLIIGYTDQQMADINYNEGKIWAHFIEKSLLFETSHFKVNKYTGERPSVPEISARCPGRIATWVGWQIVKKYMAENPQVTLPQLMAETDAQKLFTQSKYKPKRN